MPGPTLSPTEFATVTGMTRDRLRTWERRYGWPRPDRAAGGARRYRTEDAARVVAVRRLQELGMPLDRAISEQTDGGTPSLGASTWRSIVDELPLPLVVLSGPVPLCIEFVNAMLRERPDGPRAGDLLEDLAPWFSGEDAEGLRRLFAADARVAWCAHPDWTAAMSRTAHSLAVRVPQGPRSQPLVTLVGTDAGLERRLPAERAHHRRERARLQEESADVQAWCAVAREVGEFAVEPGLRAVRAGLHALRRRTHASDAALYVVHGDEMRLLTSLRGRFASPPDGASADVLRDTWLDPEAAAEVGAPRDHGLVLTATAMPGGGSAVIALASQEPLSMRAVECDLFDVCAQQLARAVVVPRDRH